VNGNMWDLKGPDWKAGREVKRREKIIINCCI
jgi:hypothetical protein